MVTAGGNLDTQLLVQHWHMGRDEHGQPIPHNAETAIWRAWVADQTGHGPFGAPWGVPLSRESGVISGDRIIQFFTNGVAVYWMRRSDDDPNKVTFN